MTKPPSFLRRADHPSVSTIETGVRDILAKLNANADHEVTEILAGGINLYSAATIRFRGDSSFKAHDIKALLSIWQILLDVKREPEANYAKPGGVTYANERKDHVEPIEDEQ